MSEVPYLLPQFSSVGTVINRMAYGDEIFNDHGQKILEMNLSERYEDCLATRLIETESTLRYAIAIIYAGVYMSCFLCLEAFSYGLSLGGGEMVRPHFNWPIIYCVHLLKDNCSNYGIPALCHIAPRGSTTNS